MLHVSVHGRKNFFAAPREAGPPKNSACRFMALFEKCQNAVASFSAGTSLISLEIRQDSCGKSPCLTKKSALIQDSANFQTGPCTGYHSCRAFHKRTMEVLKALSLFAVL